MRYYLALLLTLLMFNSQSTIASDNKDSAEASNISYRNLRVVPEKLTADQFRGLRDKGVTSLGCHTLTVQDKKQFQSQLPSSFRVLTKGAENIVSRISANWDKQYITSGDNGESYLVIPYSGKDTYGGQYNFLVKAKVSVISDPSNFDGSDKLTYLDIYQSPLGANDFINQIDTPSIARQYNFFFLSSFLDDKFVSQLRKTNNLNQNIKTLFLIAAQQEGEDIIHLPEGGRKLRATELFSMYLYRHGIKPLESDNEFLPPQLSAYIVKDLAVRIFENSGYSPEHFPNSAVEKASLKLCASDDSNNDHALFVLMKLATEKTKYGKISSLRVPLFSKQPTDFLLLALQKRAELLKPVFAETNEIGAPTSGGMSNKDIAWLILRWGGIDPLERHIVGLGTDFAAKMIGKKIPMGGKLCKGMVYAAHILGRKSVADLCVDITNGDIRTKTLITEGIQSKDGMKALNTSAECLIGLIPFGNVGYAGTTAVVRLLGYESPIHLVFQNKGIDESEDRGLSATSSILRTGIKMVIPGGSLLLGASDGIAWYLGEKTMTHAAYHYIKKEKK